MILNRYIHGDCIAKMKGLDYPFDLIVTSPPYGLGLEYETKLTLEKYQDFADAWTRELPNLLTETGSLWLNVGRSSCGTPLSFVYSSILGFLNLQFQQEIIWEFPSGGAASRKFSPRHETWLWYTKSSMYKFNLDAVRIETQYQSDKRNNPNGKNPGSVWYIQQCRKTEGKGNHPCQWPLSMIQRIIEACTDKGDTVFDPFAGSGTALVAAKLLGRKYFGIDNCLKYVNEGNERILKSTIFDLMDN